MFPLQTAQDGSGVEEFGQAEAGKEDLLMTSATGETILQVPSPPQQMTDKNEEVCVGARVCIYVCVCVCVKKEGRVMRLTLRCMCVCGCVTSSKNVCTPNIYIAICNFSLKMTENCGLHFSG